VGDVGADEVDDVVLLLPFENVQSLIADGHSGVQQAGVQTRFKGRLDHERLPEPRLRDLKQQVPLPLIQGERAVDALEILYRVLILEGPRILIVGRRARESGRLRRLSKAVGRRN
jgi:hypothetical protein